jgi:hypothetical protein
MPDKQAAPMLIEGGSGHDDPQRKSGDLSQPLSSSSQIQQAKIANTLHTKQVRTVLNRLFTAAAHDDETRRWRQAGLSWETATAQERADASESTCMPISPRGGDLLYILVRARHGDTMSTLNDIPGPIDLVLLDGGKDLCLPVLCSLESRLAIGALIVADDINLPSLSDYLEYVRYPANGYVSIAFPLEDGMEIGCWTGDGRSAEKGPSSA